MNATALNRFKSTKALLQLIVVVCCKSVFSQDIDFYNTYFEGNGFYAQKEYTKAVKSYNEAIAMFPKGDYVYFNRGNARYELKDYKGALADYNKTLSMNNQYAEAYYQRAKTKFRLSQRESACEDLKKAKKLECPGAAYAVKKNCK